VYQKNSGGSCVLSYLILNSLNGLQDTRTRGAETLEFRLGGMTTISRMFQDCGSRTAALSMDGTTRGVSILTSVSVKLAILWIAEPL
jgi:hypothetical protein